MFFSKTDDPAFPDFTSRRWGWKTVAIVSLACALAAVAARPAYHGAKTWRARSLAAQAEGFLKDKNWKETVQKAQGAYRLAPGDPTVLRVFARLYSRVGVPSAYDFWVRFLETPLATAADRKEAARFGLQFNKMEFAEEQCGKLLNAAPNDPETLELAVQLAIQKGDRSRALDFVHRLITASPAHLTAPVLNAQLLFTSPEREQQAEGRRQLEQLSQGDTLTSLTALRTLAGSASLSAEQGESISAALAAHPLATTDDQLTVASMQIRAKPERRRELIDATIQRFVSQGPDALASLGRWVNQQGEHERVTEFITLADSLTRQDLLLVRLDALASLKRWGEIRRILTDEKPPLEEPHRQVFLARAATELGEPRAAEARWGDAVRAAGATAPALLFVAQYADKVGARDPAEEAYRRLARVPGWELRARTLLIPLLEAKGDTRSLREIVKQIAILAPTDRAPRNDGAYLDLLLNENVQGATQTAQELMRERPDLLAHRTTLALAYLRTGNGPAAAALYKNVNISWDSAPPGWKAVYAAVLEADGNHEQAISIAATLEGKYLKPEEEALLKLH